MKFSSIKYKTLIRIGVTLCAMSLLFPISSCEEKDLSDPNSDLPEGMEKITFLIPDYESGVPTFGTRAFDTEQEGYMSNLYVIAVKYADFVYDEDGQETESPASKQVYAFSLNPVGEKFNKSQDTNGDGTYDRYDYKAFNVTLYPGKYKIGLLANVDLYLDRATRITEFTSENQLNEIILNFTEETTLAPTHLPMTCLPQNIMYSDSLTGVKQSVANIEDNLVEIHRNNNTHIWANMNFLCSKVRYTILFDKRESYGISKSFGNSWIRFNVDDQNKPSAINIRRQTKLFPDGIISGDRYNESSPFIPHYDDTEENGIWSMSINRFYWSDSEGADYPKTPSSALTPWDKSTAEWIPMEAKVWQGVVYLPENNGSTQINEETGENFSIPSTVLRFPYHTRVNSLDETPEVEASSPKYIYLFDPDTQEHYEGNTNSTEYGTTANGRFTGLERNTFYDVVAHVTTPDVDEMDIKVFVSILPWHEVEQNIDDENILHNTGDQNPSNVNVNVRPWQYDDFNTVW